MFHFDRQQLAEELALHSFKDEIFQKTMVIEQLLYQFQKIEERHDSKINAKIYLKLSRQAIGQATVVLKTMKCYLLELKLQSFYDLMAKMFQLLIICFNCVSKKFVSVLKSNKFRNKTEGNQQDEDSFAMKFMHPLKGKNKVKEMEYFDYLIKGLEAQQNRLSQKKNLIEEELRQQQKYILSMTASDTVNQLDNLSIQLQRIINNSDKITGQNILYRHQELSKKILDLKKPQQLQNEYCTSISQKTKQTFITTMLKLVNSYNTAQKQTQKSQILAEINKNKPLTCETACQTLQADSKLKLIDQLQKQKKVLLSEQENLKKTNTYLQIQSEKMQERFKEMKQNIRNLTEDLNQVNKNKNDFVNQREEFEKLIHRKNQEIRSLQMQEGEGRNSGESNKATPIIGDDQNFCFNNTYDDNSKFRSILRQKANSSILVERQFQNIKKQNTILRKCFQNIISKLSSIGQFPQNSQNIPNKAVLLNQKIDTLVEKLSLLNNKPILRQLPQSSQRRSKKIDNIKGIINGIHYRKQSNKFTQTQEEDLEGLIGGDFQSGREGSVGGNSSKLDALKQQFLRKLANKKKQKKGPNRSQNKKMTFQQSHNKTFQTCNPIQTEPCQQPLKKSSQKSRYTLQRIKKQILFEQLKMEDNTKSTLQLNKSYQKSSKFNSRYHTQTCENQNPIHSRKNLEEKQLSKPMIAIENYQVSKELKRVMHTLLTKYQSQDYYMQAFLKGLLGEFTKAKGVVFLEDLLKKQLNQLQLKQSRIQQRKRQKHHPAQPPLK